MPIIFQKNASFFLSQKHCALMSFFSKFSSKTQYCHAHIWSKNANSVQTTLFYGPKKSIGCHFIPISHEKINALMKHILSKKRPFSKKHIALKNKYLSKNVHSLKTKLLSCHFLQHFYQNPMLVCPYLPKNR